MSLTLVTNHSLELSEWVLTQHRNPKDTDEGMASASSKDIFSSGVLTRVCEDRIKTILNLWILGPKRSNLHNLVQVGNRISVDTLPMAPGQMCDWAIKHSANHVCINASIWYPITMSHSPSLMPATDSESTVSSGGTQHGKDYTWAQIFQACIFHVLPILRKSFAFK